VLPPCDRKPCPCRLRADCAPTARFAPSQGRLLCAPLYYAVKQDLASLCGGVLHEAGVDLLDECCSLDAFQQGPSRGTAAYWAVLWDKPGQLAALAFHGDQLARLVDLRIRQSIRRYDVVRVVAPRAAAVNVLRGFPRAALLSSCSWCCVS
jgi:hypothetical protein